MNRKWRYPLLMALVLIGFWLLKNFYIAEDVDTANGDISLNLPLELWPESTTGAIVQHHYYAFSYHEAYEQAEWVFYGLSKDQLTYDDRKRPYFVEDPKVKTRSADWRNYRGSGYDRGHLCPAGDRRFSEAAYNETFYTSNISPQKNDFNAGVWNRLEQKVRQWAKLYGKLYVVTGGILEQHLPVIGEEDVAVPRYFYKIVVRKDGNLYKAVAFVMEHEESALPLRHFVVPIDSVEQRSGIDFFQKLPDGTESMLESETNMADWKF